LGWDCQSFDPVICTDDTDEGFAKKPNQNMTEERKTEPGRITELIS
jgi:hypothetical protein